MCMFKLPHPDHSTFHETIGPLFHTKLVDSSQPNIAQQTTLRLNTVATQFRKLSFVSCDKVSHPKHDIFSPVATHGHVYYSNNKSNKSSLVRLVFFVSSVLGFVCCCFYRPCCTLIRTKRARLGSNSFLSPTRTSYTRTHRFRPVLHLYKYRV